MLQPMAQVIYLRPFVAQYLVLSCMEFSGTKSFVIHIKGHPANKGMCSMFLCARVFISWNAGFLYGCDSI